MIFRRPFYSPSWGLGGAFKELERMRRQLDEMSGGFERRPYRLLGAGVFPLINLSISGERKIASEGDNVRYHRREREAGTFNRVVALPGEVDADKVEANHVNGVLTVVIPKAEAAKPKQITVR